MISNKELLINMFYNVIGWHNVNHTSYLKNKEISKARVEILYNNLEHNYSSLFMGELEWCSINENEIRREYSGLEKYHQDKFSHKRMDTIMVCLLLSLLLCFIIACLTEFAYFFFYTDLIGLFLYIYGYKLWNKIQGVNFLKYNIAQIEGIEEDSRLREIDPLNSILTCIHSLAKCQLVMINDEIIKGFEYEVDTNIKLSQTQFAFLLTQIVKCGKISFFNRKQTEIAKLIAKDFRFSDANINVGSLKNDLSKFYTMKDKSDLESTWNRHLPNLHKLFDSLGVASLQNQLNINN